MNHYENIRESSSETRTSREDRVTSAWPPPPPRRPSYATGPPGETLYKTELFIKPAPATHTFDNCHKCGGLISRQSNDGLKFSDRNYHRRCFTCSICRSDLSTTDEKSFLINDTGEPICRRCYTDNPASRCYACAQPIPAGRYTTYKGNSYHSDCFRCFFCRSVIREMEFPSHDNKPCCERCHQENFAAKCHQCLQPITSERSLIYAGNKYHPDCFRCGKCNRPITETQFYTRDSKPCCDQCHQKYYEPPCEQCSRPISSGETITYEGKKYHPNCFRCGQCDRVITENRLHQKNNKPCCNDCHERYFTLKCARCSQAIVDRYSTYKGQQFHPHCFVCTSCSRVIAPTEKFTEDSKGILCLGCAR